MAASLDTLGNLHSRLASVMEELLAVREAPLVVKGEAVLDAQGNPIMTRLYPTAAELSAVAAFLKNNNVTADVENTPALQALKDKLALARTKRTPVLPDPESYGMVQ